jgi:hypothetical protein
MKLDKTEKAWVSKLVYDSVKYNETYHEVLDHVISSLELEEDTKITFHQKLNQIWDDDFGGYENLSVLEKEREKAVKKQIGIRQRQLFLGYFKLPLLLTTVVLGLGFYFLSFIFLTDKMNSKVTTILMFTSALLPISIYLYMYFRLKKFSLIKPSIKESKVYHSSGLSLSIFNLIIFLPGFFDIEPGAVFKTMTPSILVLITLFFSVYTLSFLKLYKETFKMELSK